MPDSITPVGTAFPPMNPLASLSSVVGIQQQKQQLQLQAQELQRSQIDTQQAQGVNQFFSQVPPDQLHDAQGNISADMAHQRPEYQALPGVARVAVDTKINQLQNQQLQNKQALTTMNGDLVSQFGKTAQAASQQSPEEAQATLRAWGQQSPENQRILNIYAPALKSVPPQHLPNALTAIGAQAQDVTQQQSQTNPAQLQVNTGGATQLYNVNKAAGLKPGQTPVASVPNTLGPAQQLPYLGAAAGATAGASARAGGTGNADVDTSNTVVSAQRDARTNIDLTKRIDQLADAVDPGAVPAKISQTLGALGLQNVNQARTELQKDLGRLRGGMAQRAQSDSRAGEVLAGLPTDTTPTPTIHQAMDFTRGTARQDLALGALREKNASSTNGQMTGFQGDYAHAVGAAGPLTHEFNALSPQEQVGFFQRNFKTKAEAQAFRAQAQSVKKLSPDVLGSN